VVLGKSQVTFLSEKRTLLSLNAETVIGLLLPPKAGPSNDFVQFQNLVFSLGRVLLCPLWYVPMMAERSSLSNFLEFVGPLRRSSLILGKLSIAVRREA
jgi:hypothetical protein